jgi:hypothetical protein
MGLGGCLSSVKNVAEIAQCRLDEILTEAAKIQIEDFSGTHNWTISIKKASAKHGSAFHAHIFETDSER